LSFNKDTLRNREKDYTNINSTGNGKLTLYFGEAGHQLNVQFSDTSGKVHFTYRGSQVIPGQPLIVIDSVNLFCSCDTAGIYGVDFFLTDQLGKTTTKTLIVKCSANQKATVGLYAYLTDDSQSQSWTYRLDGSTSFKTDGIITAYHFSINGQPILSNSPFLDFTFHAVGTHDLALYVTDDLGMNSDTVHRQILIIP